MPADKKIAFNLSTIERAKTYEPYVLALKDGSTIVLSDPKDLDWKDLVKIQNPMDFFRYCVSEDDKPRLREEKIEGWKLRLLIEDFQRHYDLDTSGNGDGSPGF